MEEEVYSVKISKTKRPLSFTAIDFETATASRMACQLGLVVVENGEIVKEKEYLFQPPENRYDEMCMKVHKITPAMTAGSPTFEELWPEIAPDLDGKNIAAHNLAFDMDVLKRNLEHYQIPMISIASSFCTCNDIGQVTLPYACKHFGIPLEKHHNALDDARACAKLALAYRDLAGCEISILQKKKKIRPVKEKAEKVKKAPLKPVEATITDSMFSGKKVVVSGVFDEWPDRNDLKIELMKRGCQIISALSSKVDFLIAGNKAGPSKMQKAEELGIPILHEEDIQL